MAYRILTADDYAFFRGISKAVLLNPFTEERKELDESLIGKSARKNASWDDVVNELNRELNQRLETLHSDDLRQATPEERIVIERAVLFQLFHQYSETFDRLIHGKKHRGPVSEIDQMIAHMRAYGIEQSKAHRYIGMMFQLRRAYVQLAQIVGSGGAMQAVRAQVWANIFTTDIELFETSLWDRMEDFSVMIVGETGSGKGVVARALGLSGWIPYDHKQGRFEEDFVEQFLEINLSQFPESLIESELFGHQKGAFTGAISDHTGVFERCPEHGAIFIDELGETSEPVQIKLLRVLQERAFSPVGSHESRRFVGRIIAATNRNLDELRTRGEFRNDFYYRLCSDVIAIPTLRARIAENPSELEELLDHIVEKLLGERHPAFVDRVLDAIGRDLPKGYSWPGNVRELEQCVRRVITTGAYSGDPISASTTSDADALAAEFDAGSIDARTLLTRYCQMLYAKYGTYEDVAKRTRLDRRTVKKYVVSGSDS